MLETIWNIFMTKFQEMFFLNEDKWKKRHLYFDFQYDTHVIEPGISTLVNNKWLIFKSMKNTFKRACQL